MKHCVFVLLFLQLFAVHSASYDEIMSSSLSGSYLAEEAEIRHSAGLISISEAELDDEIMLGAELSVSPLLNNMEAVSVDDLSFSFTSPDSDTKFSASLPFAIAYDRSGGYLSPSASFRHVFDWGHDDDELEDLQVEVLRLSVSREYEEDMLSLERSVISILTELLTNEKDIKEAREALSDAQAEESDAVTLDLMSEDSLAFLELQLARERAEDTLLILERERNALVLRYHSLTGLEWDGVEDIPDPSFPDILAFTTSSAVDEARLQAEIAKEEVLVTESLQKPERLVTGLDASSMIEMGQGWDSTSSPLSLSASIGWEGDSWSLIASGGGNWDADFAFSPQLTITASWENGSSESDDLTLRSLRNTARMRSVEAANARREFQESSEDLWSSIVRWEREKAELDADVRYQNAFCEMQELKYERGLITQEELEDSSDELSSLLLELDIKKLEGLALEAEAESLVL